MLVKRLKMRVFLALVVPFAVLTSVSAVAQASPANESLSQGTVVSLRGTPHLWFVEGGALHWGGDTRALRGHSINWNNRIDVSLDELRRYPIGSPWLSLGLLKEGDPIYLVKWESGEAAPQLLHIQSIGDVELFGITAYNYGDFVLDRTLWEGRFGLSAGNLPRSTLGRAVNWPPVTSVKFTVPPPPAPPVVGPAYRGQVPESCDWGAVVGRRVAYICVYPDGSNAAWRDPADNTLLAFNIGTGAGTEFTSVGLRFFGFTPPPPPPPVSPPPVVQATITSAFTGYAKDRVFELDNGQIWLQTESWTQSWSSTRPRVLIYQSGLNWKLHLEQGAHDVVVRRLK
jgi:hypothetical protein